MAKEIFIVKNVSTNNIEIKDFGIIIFPGDSIDLIDFEEAYISEEVETFINNGDLVRVINGIDVSINDAFKDNIPNFNGPVSFLNIIKTNTQTLTSSYADVIWDNTITIDNNAFEFINGNSEIIFKTNSKYLVIGNLSINQIGGNSRSDSKQKILIDKGSGYIDILGTESYNYSRNNAQGKETASSIAVIDVSIGHKLKMQAALNSGGGTLELTNNGCSLILSNILGQPGPEGLPGNDPNITIQENGNTLYDGLFPILNIIGYNVDVSSNNNQIDLNFSFDNLNSLGLHTDSDYSLGTTYGMVSFNSIDVSIGTSVIQTTPTDFKFNENGIYLISFNSTVTTTATNDIEIEIVKNNTTVIPSSYKLINVYTNETHHLITTILFNAAENDTINIQVKAGNTTSTLKSNANLNIIKLSGIKGDKGDKGDPGTPGSGSTIVVGDGNINNDFTINKLNFLNDLKISQDNSTGNISIDTSINILKDGTLISPTKNLNFKNNNIIITPNSNNIDIEVEKPIYGTEFNYVENLTSTSTTATSPQDRLTMNLTNLPTGKYKLTVSTRYNMSSITKSALFDITLDGNPIGNQTPISIEIQDATNIEVLNETIFLDLSGNHTIKFRNYVEGNTMTISDSRMELIRVS